MDVAIWKAAEEGVGLRLYHDGVSLEHWEPDHNSGINSTRVGVGGQEARTGECWCGVGAEEAEMLVLRAGVVV